MKGIAQQVDGAAFLQSRLIMAYIFSQNWPKIQRSRVKQGFGMEKEEEKNK